MSVRVEKLDFVSLGLPEYRNKLALVIDGAFTAAECDRLVQAAEHSSSWSAASGDATYRDSGRILLDSPELTEWILFKLRPFLADVERVEKGYLHKAHPKVTQEQNGTNTTAIEPVVLTKLNPRLRFLRYGEGQQFQRHYDATTVMAQGSLVSYYTMQLYLGSNGPDSGTELQGGTTRFWTRRGTSIEVEKGDLKEGSGRGVFVDVLPLQGRVLIFEQIGMFHSGEPVHRGVKLSMRAELMYEVEERQ